MFIIFIVSVIFLFGFLFLPIGYLNDVIIAPLPLFLDDVPDVKIWEWKNIAAFVITYFISILLLIYFRSRQLNLGIGIGFVINLVSTLILFTVVWMTEVSSSAEYTFNYGFGWLFWFIGLVLFYFSRNKKTGS
jgi:hypothetical protein